MFSSVAPTAVATFASIKSKNETHLRLQNGTKFNFLDAQIIKNIYFNSYLYEEKRVL